MSCLYFNNLPHELTDGMKDFGTEYDFEVVETKADADIIVTCEYTADTILEATRDDNIANITYCNKAHIFRAVGEVIRNIGNTKYSFKNTVNFDDVCVMIDFSQGNQATKPEYLKKVLLRFAAMGITSLMMYLEDGYEIQGEPYFGYMRPRYTYNDIKLLDDYAYSLGIEIVPCIQTLGHLSNVLRWTEVYGDICDDRTTLLVGEDSTYELIRKMLVSASAPVRTKRIHVGMDEAWRLGLGEYIKKNGYKKGSEIFRQHLDRVMAIARELGLEPMIWVDMFFRTIIEENGLPSLDYRIDFDINFTKNVDDDIPALIYWDYNGYPDTTRTMIKNCKKLSDDIIVAGALRNNRGFAQKHEIDNKNADTILPICKELGIRNVMVTIWGDNAPEGNHFSSLLGIQLYAEHCFSEVVDKVMWYSRFEFCAKCNPKAFEDLKLFDMPCGIKEPDTIVNYNFSKYLLWQDPLLGLFDANIAELDLKTHYEKLANSMKVHAVSNPEYKMFFEFYEAAAVALSVKADLGVTLRKLYKNGGKLDDIRTNIVSAITVIKNLHRIHRDFWFLVNNPMGWEILDNRYGALLSRLETALVRFEQYFDGMITNIPELEEPRLYYNGRETMPQELEYTRIVSASHTEIIR